MYSINLSNNQHPVFNMSIQTIETISNDLNQKGYCIVKNVLCKEEITNATELFYSWKNSIPDLDKIHSTINPHCIFKFHEIGHQEHAWFLRTRPQIIALFKKIWNCDELVTSFDGFCYMPTDLSKKNNCWTHTDQAANKKGANCYQSFISLTNNKEKTLVVYEGSHLLHERYFEEKNITGTKNWSLIDIEYLKSIEDKKRILEVNEGDLVIWDSRTFHQNNYGSKSDGERLVQYLCYLPKNNKGNTKAQQKKREKYFIERRTTSHWPYSITVNGLQPQTYGDKEKLIDYSKLKAPDLSKYVEIIKTLI